VGGDGAGCEGEGFPEGAHGYYPTEGGAVFDGLDEMRYGRDCEERKEEYSGGNRGTIVPDIRAVGECC